MEPISPWTATAQEQLRKGTIILERKLQAYDLTIILAEFCLWIVAQWPEGGEIAFRAAFAANDELTLKETKETQARVTFLLSGFTGNVKVELTFPDAVNAVFRYVTTITPAFDMLVPYWPRDIMPLYKSGKTQNTKGTVHASQVGTRSGQLYFSLEKPETGSVFYLSLIHI